MIMNNKPLMALKAVTSKGSPKVTRKSWPEFELLEQVPYLMIKLYDQPHRKGDKEQEAHKAEISLAKAPKVAHGSRPKFQLLELVPYLLMIAQCHSAWGSNGRSGAPPLPHPRRSYSLKKEKKLLWENLLEPTAGIFGKKGIPEFSRIRNTYTTNFLML